MKKFVVGIVAVFALLYAVALAIPINPDEQRPGTRLSGNLVADPHPDWSYLEDRQKIWVQTNTWYLIPHSVTTISFVSDNELYVPCGWCAEKLWPKYVAADPHVTVKIGDNLYERVAIKIPEESERRRILNVPPGEATPDFDLYRMDAPNG